MEWIAADLDILARTRYGEARGEHWLGQVAVAWVIKTRTASPRIWRATVREVCQQPWQFSCWNPNDPNRRLLLGLTAEQDATFRTCLAAAAVVLTDLAPDPTGGANHYLNLKVLAQPPRWYDATKVTATLGRHTFLRL
jgi:cell wall hydrolase